MGLEGKRVGDIYYNLYIIHWCGIKTNSRFGNQGSVGRSFPQVEAEGRDHERLGKGDDVAVLDPPHVRQGAVHREEGVLPPGHLVTMDVRVRGQHARVRLREDLSPFVELSEVWDWRCLKKK